MNLYNCKAYTCDYLYVKQNFSFNADQNNNDLLLKWWWFGAYHTKESWHENLGKLKGFSEDF